jgi:ribosomal protein S18 acetylase RimI-like enzyme
MVEVREVSALEPGLIEAMAALLPQLSKSAPPLEEPTLAAVIEHQACHFLVAEEDGVLLGSLTLVVFPIPTGVRAWIEDVVVDEAARGKGVGAMLNTFALDVAASLGARSVDLTSRPSREAANRLYQRLGFEQRDTNVYRHQG